MSIPAHHRRNFQTLERAFAQGRAALLEVRDKATQEVRYAIVAIGDDRDGFAFSPFALMIDGNPFELLEPPNPDGGFSGFQKGVERAL